jgi:hypothetical protein
MHVQWCSERLVDRGTEVARALLVAEEGTCTTMMARADPPRRQAVIVGKIVTAPGL